MVVGGFLRPVKGNPLGAEFAPQSMTVDPEYIAWLQKEGASPAEIERLQATTSSGTEFDPLTGRPWGVGELTGEGEYSVGYWKPVGDRRLSGQPEGYRPPGGDYSYDSLAGFAGGINPITGQPISGGGPGYAYDTPFNEFDRNGNPNLQYYGEGGQQAYMALSPDEKRALAVQGAQRAAQIANDKWIANKKEGGPLSDFLTIARVAAGTALAGFLATPNAMTDFLTEHFPTQAQWVSDNLPDAINPFSNDTITNFDNWQAQMDARPGILAGLDTAAPGLGGIAGGVGAGGFTPAAAGFGGLTGNAAPVTAASTAPLGTQAAGAATAGGSNPVLLDNGTWANTPAGAGGAGAAGGTGAAGGLDVSQAGFDAAVNTADVAGGSAAAAGGVTATGAAAGGAGLLAGGNAAKIAQAATATTGAAAGSKAWTDWIDTAIGIVGAGGTIASSILGASAAKKAASAEQRAAEAALALQKEQYDQTREDLRPWREEGTAAVREMGELTRGNFSSFEESPGYNFRLNEGIKAQDRSAAARGLLLSGRQIKETERFAQGTASNEYGNYWNRLSTLAGTGQTATTNTSAAGQNYANQGGININRAGDARASGFVGSNNAYVHGANQLLNTAAYRR